MRVSVMDAVSLFARIIRGILGRCLRCLTVKMFSLWERLGIHVTPVHFYQTIPDTRELDDSLWQEKSDLVGVDMNDDSQIHLMNRLGPFIEEFSRFPDEPTSEPYQYYKRNTSFAGFDGAFLYGMIRLFQPRRVVEIGSGFSTRLSAAALLRNADLCGHQGELIAIDPYAGKEVRNGFHGLSMLINQKVQEVHLSEFAKLGPNDILFMDSSHVLSIGSDVQYEYLEIIPRLREGVLVHIHDICFPNELPREYAMKHRWFWNEQYLLQAFLAYNGAFEVMWSSSYMSTFHLTELEVVFGDILRQNPERMPGIGGSFWMRRL